MFIMKVLQQVSFAASSPAKETVLLLPRLVLERVTTTETPRARESNEEFFRRLSGIDAMEGPSWLFNESPAAARHSDQRQSDQRQSDQRKKSDQRQSDQRQSDQRQSDPRQSDQRQSDQRESVASASNETSELGESDAGSRKRSSRRAGSAASYKEPSLNKKMRQGDPNSASVYKDYVPQTKAKKKSSGGSGRSKKNPPKK